MYVKILYRMISHQCTVRSIIKVTILDYIIDLSMKKTQYVGLVTIGLLAVLLATAAIGYPQAVFAHDDDDDDGGAAAAAAAGDSAAAAAASGDSAAAAAAAGGSAAAAAAS
jgi:hypothetical protein